MQLVTEEEAANILGLSKQTLASRRRKSKSSGTIQNLPYLIIGEKSIRYAIEDIDKYLAQNRVVTKIDTFDFFKERCTIDSEGMILRSELYKAYTEWAKDKGVRPVTIAVFGMAIRNYFPELYDYRESKNGVRKRYYTGIQFLDA
jgi:hypothetical protein